MVHKPDLVRALDKEMLLIPGLKEQLGVYGYTNILRGMRTFSKYLEKTEAFEFCEDFTSIDEYREFRKLVHFIADLMRDRGVLRLPGGGASYFESKFRFGVRVGSDTELNLSGIDDEQAHEQIHDTTHREVIYRLTYSDDKHWTAGVIAIDGSSNSIDLFAKEYALGHKAGQALGGRVLPEDCLILMPFFRLHNTPKNYFHYYVSHTYINKGSEGPLVSREYRDLKGFVSPKNQKEPSYFYDLMNGLLEVAEDIVLSTIVMLNTDRGESRRVVPPIFNKKPHLLSRLKPSDGHTVVTVRPGEKPEPGEGPGTPRHKQREHYRRGHPKRQRYGVGRKLVKTIYVERYKAGDPKEGTITHDEYRVLRRPIPVDSDDGKQ